MSSQDYLLTVELLHLKPKIWRSFTVSANILLSGLHGIIQVVMGWENSHLYLFKVGSNEYMEDPEEEDLFEARDYRLCDLVKSEGDRLEYAYDFGDSWEHLITVKKIARAKRNLKPNVICWDGARACPPEDVGGVPGYFEFCDIIKNPKHEEYESFMVWAGGNYDSEKFDRDQVNFRLEGHGR